MPEMQHDADEEHWSGEDSVRGRKKIKEPRAVDEIEISSAHQIKYDLSPKRTKKSMFALEILANMLMRCYANLYKYIDSNIKIYIIYFIII
jgi:hypothetical protein